MTARLGVGVVATSPLTRMESVVGAGRVAQVRAALRSAQRQLDGRAIWHVSENTSRGGVAEALGTVLPYLNSEGIVSHWLSMQGSPEFRKLTKELYYCLCGVARQSAVKRVRKARALYEQVCRDTAARIVGRVDRSSLIIVHDHQAAGLLPYLRDAGYTAIWRIHVSHQSGAEVALRAWDFLSPYAAAAHVAVVSTPGSAPVEALVGRCRVIPLSIDPFAVKNHPIQGGWGSDAVVDPPGVTQMPRYGDPVPRGVPLITQVSRWDKVKDIPGVIRMFVEHVDPSLGAHLALVGPQTVQDRHGHEVFMECVRLWSRLGYRHRRRIHLVRVPAGDLSEHARVINAVQRRSTGIVQRSRAEGFGLTVTEAGWKAKPVVASSVGGISYQVEHGRTGFLVSDIDDLHAMGAALNRVISDPELARRLGENARDRVREKFLIDTHLHNIADFVSEVSASR